MVVNLFIPFVIAVITITAYQWLVEYMAYMAIVPEPPPRRDFIPDRPPYYARLKAFAGSVTYAEPVLNQELIQWSLEYVEKIPEHKDCFPEIKRAIVDFCSNNPGYVSEFQYIIIALRTYNCLRLRSLGAEEIDFDIVEENFQYYIKKMTKTEWNFYHEAYNVVRGLCANERQHESRREVKYALKYNRDGLVRHVKYMRRIRVRAHSLAKNTILKCKKKLDAEKKTIERTGKQLERTMQRAMQRYPTKFHKHTAAMTNIVEEGNLYIKTLQNTLSEFARNHKRIGLQLNSENSLHSLWEAFILEYDIKTNEMGKKTAAMGLKLGRLSKLNQKYKNKSKIHKVRRQARLRELSFQIGTFLYYVIIVHIFTYSKLF